MKKSRLLLIIILCVILALVNVLLTITNNWPRQSAWLGFALMVLATLLLPKWRPAIGRWWAS